MQNKISNETFKAISVQKRCKNNLNKTIINLILHCADCEANKI